MRRTHRAAPGFFTLPIEEQIPRYRAMLVDDDKVDTREYIRILGVSSEHILKQLESADHDEVQRLYEE